MITDFIKCPYCGSKDIDQVRPSTGTSFILTEVNTNTNPPEFLATCGLPVYVFGCVDCKRISLVCPSLRKENSFK